MVVDTKGVNVWCSAGKGTFCADEVVRRIEAVRLPEVVSASQADPAPTFGGRRGSPRSKEAEWVSRRFRPGAG